MSPKNKPRVAIFASGSGTNLENIARRVQAGELECEIALLVCDNPQAFALKRAEKFGIKTFVIDRKPFKTKQDFDAAIDARLRQENIQFIFLAGYMRILTPELVRAWQWKIINVHPSLLPKFPGAHAIKDAFEAKVSGTGVTVHFVDEGVDTGPIILQKKVFVQQGDTLETLEARVHETEYELYPEAIKLVLEGKAGKK